METKKNKFIEWLKLAIHTGNQRGRVHCLHEKYQRLYEQIQYESMHRQSDDELACFICPSYSQDQECKISCAYNLLNNLYIKTKAEYNEACKTYQMMVDKRKSARRELFSRKAR